MTANPLTPLLHFLRRLGAGPAPDAADAALLARFGGGDGDAFAALVARHGPLVLGVCRRILGDLHDAEDAFQAVFLVLARKGPQLRRPGALAAWLHGVARRTALKLRTRLRRGVAEPLAADPADDPGPPADRLARAEEAEILDAEIGRLPPAYREAVILCYLQGRTYREAAALLGWPVGTVSVRLARARRMLRVRLARHGFPFLAAAVGGGGASAALAVPVPAPVSAGLCAAASALAQGRAADQVVPQSVSALVEEMMQSLLWKKVSAWAAAVAVGLVLLAGGGIGYHAVGSLAGEPDSSPAPASGPAAKGDPAGPGANSAGPGRVGPAAGQNRTDPTVPGKVAGEGKNDPPEPQSTEPEGKWREVERSLRELEKEVRELRRQLDRAGPAADVLRVATPVKGLVQAVHVRRGQRVGQGEVLLQLDDRLARNALEQAQARLGVAKAEYQAAEAVSRDAVVQNDRAEALYQRAVISSEEVTKRKFGAERARHELEAKADSLRVAEAQYQAAKLVVDQYRILAPAPGTVVAVLRRPGEGVQELEAVVELRPVEPRDEPGRP